MVRIISCESIWKSSTNLGQVANLIKINLLTIDFQDTKKTIGKMENTKTPI